MAPPVLDAWGMLQAKTIRLEAATLLLVLTTAGLAAVTGWLVLRPPPIYYVPTTVGPGLLRPGEVPEVLATDLAQQLVLILYNVTPATVAAAHQTMEKYLHPTLLTPFRVQAEQERQRMATEDLSAQLSIRAAQVTRLPDHQQVSLAALRRVYVGKVPIRDEDVEAVITLQPVRPSVLNPYGLVVTDLRILPPLVDPGSAVRMASAHGRRRGLGGQP
jgi:hypothetical protein